MELLPERLFSQTVCERDFPGRKVLCLLLKFFLQLLIMRFQNQRVAERVAVVKHFFHMGAAEADLCPSAHGYHSPYRTRSSRAQS